MLSPMARIFFHQSPLLIFPVVALFIFIGAFAIIAIRTFGADSEAISAAAALPLQDDTSSQPSFSKEGEAS